MAAGVRVSNTGVCTRMVRAWLCDAHASSDRHASSETKVSARVCRAIQFRMRHQRSMQLPRQRVLCSVITPDSGTSCMSPRHLEEFTLFSLTHCTVSWSLCGPHLARMPLCLPLRMPPCLKVESPYRSTNPRTVQQQHASNTTLNSQHTLTIAILLIVACAPCPIASSHPLPSLTWSQPWGYSPPRSNPICDSSLVL